MRSAIVSVALTLGVVSTPAAQTTRAAAASFSLEQVRAYPFPSELTTAATGARVAWAFNEQGRRNIYVAEGPAFAARPLTHYDRDDGQELSSVAVSANGKWVVYVRGGDHGSNWDDELPVNVSSSPVPPKVQIFSVPFDGGEPKPIGDGDLPVVSPRGDVVAFVKGSQIWTAPIDGSAPAKALFTVRGETDDPRWSPDGSGSRSSPIGTITRSSVSIRTTARRSPGSRRRSRAIGRRAGRPTAGRSRSSGCRARVARPIRCCRRGPIRGRSGPPMRQQARRSGSGNQLRRWWARHRRPTVEPTSVGGRPIGSSSYPIRTAGRISIPFPRRAERPSC